MAKVLRCAKATTSCSVGCARRWETILANGTHDAIRRQHFDYDIYGDSAPVRTTEGENHDAAANGQW